MKDRSDDPSHHGATSRSSHFTSVFLNDTPVRWGPTCLAAVSLSGSTKKDQSDDPSHHRATSHSFSFYVHISKWHTCKVRPYLSSSSVAQWVRSDDPSPTSRSSSHFTSVFLNDTPVRWGPTCLAAVSSKRRCVTCRPRSAGWRHRPRPALSAVWWWDSVCDPVHTAPCRCCPTHTPHYLHAKQRVNS